MLNSFDYAVNELLRSTPQKDSGGSGRFDTDVERGQEMRARQVRSAAAIPLIACALAGCGGSDDERPSPIPGKTVAGETETGMKLKVETFFDPAKDPALKKFADWRAENRYPAVDFHRVTADNSAGQSADSGRTLRFARNANAIATGQSVEARFTCDALQFEWVPVKESDTPRWQELYKELCADGPPKQDGIAAGARKVYFVVTDRGFAERGIRQMRVYGPRDVEFK
jgi:hypothetical protein